MLVAAGGGGEPSDGLVPVVQGQYEFAPMHGEQGLRAQVECGLHGFFGRHVDVFPCGVVLP